MKLWGGTRRGISVPLAVFAFFVLCFALHPFSPFFTHHLADPDDTMRLNEVVSWLQGQSWYDVSVPRLSPGAHTVVHWSRLIDLPIALIAMPFIPSFGLQNAVLLAAFIVPLLWFALLLVLIPLLTRVFLAPARAQLSCVMILFMPQLLFNFTPGRVDHHCVQAIIAAFSLLCLTGIIRNTKGPLCAALAALAFSCGFWIGTEALPWAMIFIACLGLAAATQGERVARTAALFGVCLPLFTAALIPLALPPTEYSSRALSWFSPAYAIFAALSGAIFLLGWRATCKINGKATRLTLYALLALAAAASFFAFIPSALHGPFADYDAFDATTALDNISEAQPLILALHFNRYMPLSLIPVALTFGSLLALPLAALLFCLWSAQRTKNELRLCWFAQSAFLFSATALTVFWQARVGIFMGVFAVTPLTCLLCAAWDKAKELFSGRSLFWTEIVIFLFLGPLPVVLLPALLHKTPLYPDIALFPAKRSAAVCPLEPLAPFLNDPSVLGTKPLVIMNTSDTGPQLLFSTRHSAIAGNFNVAGNADAFTFFNATEDVVAQSAAKKWNADIVLVCRTVPTMYLGKNYYAMENVRLQPGKDGQLHFTNINPNQPLIARLTRGEIPAWLKPIEIPAPSDYLLFRVQY